MNDIDFSLNAQLTRVVLPLIAVTEDATWHPVGTAFVISMFTPSTALLLTAAHNLRHLVVLDTPPSGHAASTPLEFLPPPPKTIDLRSTRFYAGIEGPRGFVLAEMLKSWHQNDTDIAILLVVIPDGFAAEFTAGLAVDFSPVATGTILTAVGYAEMAAQFASPPDYELQDFRISFRKTIAERSGPVTAIHTRGIGIYKWPGFIVECPFDSGMSGAPLIDLSREVPIVRGIVCGDLSEDDQNGRAGSGAHAFGSVLWPVLGTPLDLSVQLASTTNEIVQITRLVDLVSHKVFDDRGDSLVHFRCVEKDSGYTVAWI